MSLAVEKGDWESAQSLAHLVLLQHHDDPDALQMVAKAAHGNGDLDVAADLMQDACLADSYADPELAKLAVASLLQAGRIFDSIELLERAVEAQPEASRLRRMLYQMCWAVEDRTRAQPHGRYLIRSRHFDFDLLLELSANEQRDENAESLTEMVRRHPQDKRPLIAEARVRFDRGDFDTAAELLFELLRTHPSHAPAIALLSRVLVDSGRHSEFVELVSSAPTETEMHPFFWLAKGDWFAGKGLTAHAARAYWEATLRGPELRLPWLRLLTSLKQIGQPASGLDPSQVDAIDQRVKLLTMFSQTRAEFVKSGTKSPRLAIKIAKMLHELGRPWEAEAWASIAILLSSDEDLQDVRQARLSIMKSLSRTTPWQTTASHIELEINLVHLPLPDIGQNHRSDLAFKGAAVSTACSSVPISFVNEAEARALVFFGKTGSQLHKPGVGFYQTLGCGGGTIDFDRDGWSDLYLAAAGGTPPTRDSQSSSLWRNQDGVFQSVTLESYATDAGFGQGVAVGDVNEDGFADLLLMNYGPNSLMVNNGDGTFSNATESLGVTNFELEWSSSGAIADINVDGLADLTILNYGAGLEPVTRRCLHPTTKIPRACSPLVFPGVADRFLFNTGSSMGGSVTFVDRTSQCSAPSIVGRGLGLIVGSFEANVRLGIFVANDMNSNHYWSKPSDGELLLDETGIMRGLGSDDRAPAQGSMGIAAADLDRDGDLDLYVTNFQGESNTYHEQVGGRIFRDQTNSLQLAQPTIPLVGFGTQAIDFDNDGTLELIVLNGHVDDFPGDASSSYAQPIQVFQRQSNGVFSSITESIGGEYASQVHVGRALWTIDANRDGRTDFVATHQTEPVALLINQTENSGNWISLKLAGRSCSRDAIGSRVALQCGDWVATGFVTAGDGYLCSNEQILHFGLADQGACRLEVTWPDGSVDLIDGLDVNHCWLLTQGSSQAFELR
ncbi:FG-GAP-like repeat-containing protein [Neorhodopirellula pilleata]|uniref:FG-GAP-like repeat-containing protein n=1 Tax=Neorhodopirellula pilleata TaxID=2714738 RepID=UPI001E56FB6C|nr:FG-GAP-like repeat-containing protein [Neorhodopirellula pilleata]